MGGRTIQTVDAKATAAPVKLGPRLGGPLLPEGTNWSEAQQCALYSTQSLEGPYSQKQIRQRCADLESGPPGSCYLIDYELKD